MKLREVCRWVWPCILLIPLVSRAEPPQHPGLIGLLVIPSLFAADSSGQTTDTQLPVWSAPSQASKSLATVSNADVLESHEWTYEEPAAAVYDYRHDGQTSWYQIRMMPSGKTGWVESGTGRVFHPLSSLISESLPYLTSTWDGRTWRIAGNHDSTSKVEQRKPKTPVVVADSAILENKLWFLVVVLEESPCASAEAPAVLKAGWIPAHAEAGFLNIWFYSRGC